MDVGGRATQDAKAEQKPVFAMDGNYAGFAGAKTGALISYIHVTICSQVEAMFGLAILTLNRPISDIVAIVDVIPANRFNLLIGFLLGLGYCISKGSGT